MLAESKHYEVSVAPRRHSRRVCAVRPAGPGQPAGHSAWASRMSASLLEGGGSSLQDKMAWPEPFVAMSRGIALASWPPTGTFASDDGGWPAASSTLRRPERAGRWLRHDVGVRIV
jgi:hypothetical protein